MSVYIQCLLGSASHQCCKWSWAGPCSLPAFKFLNAMLMQALHSLISCFPLACLLQFAANGPPPPPFSSPTLFLSVTLSLSSLEASRFSSFAFSHNAVERVNGWGAFKRAVGGSGVWPQRVYCLREREFSLSLTLSLSLPLSVSLPPSLSLSPHWLHNISLLSR